EGLAITWAEKAGDDPIVDASGISVAKDETYKVGIESAKARHGDTSVELATLSAELDGALLLKSGKAARLAITYELPNTPDAPAPQRPPPRGQGIRRRRLCRSCSPPRSEKGAHLHLLHPRRSIRLRSCRCRTSTRCARGRARSPRPSPTGCRRAASSRSTGSS